MTRTTGGTGLDVLWARATIRALSMTYLDGRNSTAEPNAPKGRNGKLAMAAAISAALRNR